jgi:DNA-binding response OmpR family regulator
MQCSAHPAGPASARRGRVLIIEDDPEAALFAAYALERRGRFSVTHTADPMVALALAAAEPWDLALTDLDLPVISGTELIAALRAIAPGLPVILLTAQPRDGFSATDLSASRPDGLLVKPVSADQLLAAAETLALPHPHPPAPADAPAEDAPAEDAPAEDAPAEDAPAGP